MNRRGRTNAGESQATKMSYEPRDADVRRESVLRGFRGERTQNVAGTMLLRKV